MAGFDPGQAGWQLPRGALHGDLTVLQLVGATTALPFLWRSAVAPLIISPQDSREVIVRDDLSSLLRFRIG